MTTGKKRKRHGPSEIVKKLEDGTARLDEDVLRFNPRSSNRRQTV